MVVLRARGELGLDVPLGGGARDDRERRPFDGWWRLRLRVRLDVGAVADGPTPDSPGHPVTAVPGSAECPVNAASPRSGSRRSESLDGAEASPIIEPVMARVS